MAVATTSTAAFGPESQGFGKSPDAITRPMQNGSLSMNIMFGIGQSGWIRIFWLARPKPFYLQTVPTEVIYFAMAARKLYMG